MLTWKTEYDGVLIENVKVVEERLGIHFPNDYLECVTKNQGGTPSQCNIVVKEDKIVRLEYLLTYLAFDELDILDTYNTLKNQISGLVPFALGSDNWLFCFDFRFDKKPTIVLYSQQDSDYPDSYNIIYVCESFTELIQKLK